LYLTQSGALERSKPVQTDKQLSYCFDPQNPVPTIGGALTSGAPVFAGGAFDQRESADFFATLRNNRPLNERADVLSFETEPLSEDVIVAGDVRIELWVQSDSLDTDFTAKLVDVYPTSTDYPDGYAMNITDGIFRCRYRESWSEPKLLTPGQPFRITIEPFATCNVFKAGHRIRLDIASSNFPRFDINPNTGEPEGSAVGHKLARNTVHVSATMPSRLILSVLPTAPNDGKTSG
jgi:putative CocE/NonD family hydrolase